MEQTKKKGTLGTLKKKISVLVLSKRKSFKGKIQTKTKMGERTHKHNEKKKNIMRTLKTHRRGRAA